MIFIAGLLFYGLSASAQTDTMKVKPVKSSVSILPSGDVLYLSEANTITIRYKGRNKLGKVELLGGTVEKAPEMGDSVFVLNVTTGVEAVLSVYEKMKDGKQQLLFNKKYKLFKRLLPDIYLEGTKNDSVADRNAVVMAGYLFGKMRTTGEMYTVESYKLLIEGKGKLDTLSGTGIQLTSEIRNRINNLPQGKGTMLIFTDIVCRSPQGKAVTVPRLRIYLSGGEKPTKAGM